MRKKNKEKDRKGRSDKPHDKFFKQTFSKKEVALALLESRLPNDIFNLIDQNSFRLTNKNFVSSSGKNRDSDCIFQALIQWYRGLHLSSYRTSGLGGSIDAITLFRAPSSSEPFSI